MTRAQLGDVATFVSGGTPNRAVAEYYRGDVPWITGADIDDSGNISPRFGITAEAVQKSATNIIQAGALVLVTRTAVGKVATLDRATAISQDLTGVIPHAGISPDYIRNFLRFSARSLVGQARGATIKGVTRRDVASLQLPILPLGEQRRIAGILDQADAIRTKRRASLALFNELAQALFMHMFNEFKADTTVENIASFMRTGPFGSQLKHDEFVQSGIAVLGLDNVVSNTFQWGERRYITPEKYEALKRYTVRPSDVLISIMGTVGRCVIVPPDVPTAINTKHICAITPDDQIVTSEFLRAAFLWGRESRAHLHRQTKGSIMSGLNMGIIKKMPLAVPPLGVQQEFAARVEQINAQRALVERALEKDEELFASLQSRAFSGEL